MLLKELLSFLFLYISDYSNINVYKIRFLFLFFFAYVPNHLLLLAWGYGHVQVNPTAHPMKALRAQTNQRAPSTMWHLLN